MAKRAIRAALLLAIVMAFAATFGGTAKATSCVTGNVFANDATGVAYATFTVGGCSPTVSLVSYQASSFLQFPDNLPLNYYASMTENNLAPGTYTFPVWQIAQPDGFCFYEVDLVEGNVITNITAGHNYGSELVNSSWGGVNSCSFTSPPPPPSGDRTPAPSVDMAVTDRGGESVQVTNAIDDAASSTGSQLVVRVPAGPQSVLRFAVSSTGLWWQPSCTWTGTTPSGEKVLTCKLGEMDPFWEQQQSATVSIIGMSDGAISADVQPAVIGGFQQMDSAEGNNVTPNWDFSVPTE